jgi:hypothetical protein
MIESVSAYNSTISRIQTTIMQPKPLRRCVVKE